MIYVDALVPCIPTGVWRWSKACHMFTDGDLDDLHSFALRLRLRRSWFQWKPTGLPHYDLTESKRRQAIALGAVEVDRREVVRCLHYWRQKRNDV